MEADRPAFWLKETRDKAVEYAAFIHQSKSKERGQTASALSMFSQHIEYVFFDTETTGLPTRWGAPPTEVNVWPRVIQLAWAAYNKEGDHIRSTCRLIKPDGWTVPDGEFWKEHGYSTEKCEAEGVRMQAAASEIVNVIDECRTMVAHNISYDHPVLAAEMIRYGLRAKNRPQKLCTKELSTEYCAIPKAKGRGYKWPTLTELHQKLFGTDFDGAHDALADVKATARCFFELKKRGVICE